MKTIEGVEKSIADFTLRELQEVCESSDKDLCVIQGKVCDFIGICSKCEIVPADWSFSTRKRFTEVEKSYAIALNDTLAGGFQCIIREKEDSPHILLFRDQYEAISIKADAFPSADPGIQYTYKDIVGTEAYD